MPVRLTPPLLHVSKLTVKRDRSTLLNDVTWRVAPGEHWVILGPNGCGKTSLLKVLTGYLTPSGGEIDVLGERYGASDWRDLRRKVGLVTSALQASVPLDEPALETVISGKYAQLDLWMKITPGDQLAGLKFLRFTGAGALAQRLWGHLSQGERQRVLIARALMARPQLLILDEPCAGLDPIARTEFLRFVQTLTRTPRGPALVLVTHHVEEITRGFSHALILAKGKVVTQGPVKTSLTSRTLSHAFGTAVRLTRKRDGVLQLSVRPQETGQLLRFTIS